MLTEMIQDYFDQRARHEILKEHVSRAYQELRKKERALVDAMLEQGTKGMTLEDGTFVGLRKHFSCSVTQENMELVRDWLVATEGDDTPYLEERVRKPAVVELLRRKIDQEHVPPDELPEFLHVDTHPGLTVRGWKQRKEQA